MATATATRRLTAILAADVVGYSRLMGADEEGTHERVTVYLRELIEPKFREHRGRVVKTTGDGMLVEFASVVDAVRCAVEIQRGMIDREPEVHGERRIRFRIGVNLGDVIAEEHDIFGDGVNIAARLEALAEPDGICVSRVVRDQVRDRLDYTFADMGEQKVKRPVRVYALRPEAIAELPASSAPPAKAVPRPVVAPRLSIVVLPFANLSNDPEQQYFADGITQDLTADLSRIADMLVISRNTAFTYRSKLVDTRQIGRELCVRYVLEGSVQRSGNRVRVTAQLIDAETDAHVWAERFNGDTNDLFALQDEITSRIAVTLDLELVAREAARAPEHSDPLDYIFRGRATVSNPQSRARYAEAIGMFEHALALDPHSVSARSWLALTLANRVINQMSDTTSTDTARAEGLVGQALASSPRSATVHFAKGEVLRAQRRYAEAIPEYETVLAFDRNSAWGLYALGHCKLMTGSIEEVIPLIEQAIRLSPREPMIGVRYYLIGTVHLLQSHTDEAIVWFEKARSAMPTAPFVRSHLASTYALRGETERAAAELAEARRLAGDDSFSSIARMRARGSWGAPKTRALFDSTHFVGLRKAGMTEE